MGIYILFTVFFFFAIATENSSQSTKKNILIISMLVLTLIAATRDYKFWPDTYGYWGFFRDSITLSDYSISLQPEGYNEKGYFFLQVLTKTFTSEYIIFFFIVAGIGMMLICSGLRKYAIFPIFGLAIYISRFYIGRQFVQMRTGIAIGIVFWEKTRQIHDCYLHRQSVPPECLDCLSCLFLGYDKY